MLVALPVASDHSVVAGFTVLSLVIVFSLAPNGALLALASARGEGPALPLNLAVVRTAHSALNLLRLPHLFCVHMRVVRSRFWGDVSCHTCCTLTRECVCSSIL